MGRAAIAILAAFFLAAAPAAAMTRTTVERSILDTDADNRLDPAPGEDYGPPRQELGTTTSARARTRERLVFFGHMTDTHVIDEESPIRVEFLDSQRTINPDSGLLAGETTADSNCVNQPAPGVDTPPSESPALPPCDV